MLAAIYPISILPRTLTWSLPRACPPPRTPISPQIPPKTCPQCQRLPTLTSRRVRRRRPWERGQSTSSRRRVTATRPLVSTVRTQRLTCSSRRFPRCPQERSSLHRLKVSYLPETVTDYLRLLDTHGQHFKLTNKVIETMKSS